MDVRHYFDSVDFSKFFDLGQLGWKFSIGAVIEKNTSKFASDNIQKLDIAIFGVPFDSRKENTNSTVAPDKIREQLYQLSIFDDKINIVDFGNLKPASSLKGNYQALRDIVDYFTELNVVTVVIGGSQDLSYGICEAFKNNPFFAFSTVDAFLDVKKGKESFNSSNYLSRIFSSQPNLFQFSLLGFQSHYIASEYFLKTKGVNEHIRLGLLRDDMTLAESVLRNTDVLSFDIGAVKFSEAPGSNSFTPNGLRSEEACLLSKYAGLSNRLKIFGLFNIDTEKDNNNLTVSLAAQIIWYFIEGFINRQDETMNTNDNYIMYQVDVKNVDKPLVFYKNTKTNRWWMQLQSLNKELIYFGCSEKEYIKASNNEIPELWMKYIRKLDEILK